MEIILLFRRASYNMSHTSLTASTIFVSYTLMFVLTRDISALCISLQSVSVYSVVGLESLEPFSPAG